MNKSKLLWTTLSIVLVAGLVWVIASAPKSQAPQSPSEATSSANAPTPSAPGAVTPSPTPTKGTTGSGTAKNASLLFTSPKEGEGWIIGESHTIRWSAAAGTTGEIALVDAGSNQVVGWISPSTGANQTSYVWNTKSVSAQKNGALPTPLPASVSPGSYYIRLKFSSTSLPVITSGQITITGPQSAGGRTILIQNYAFSPQSVVVTRGGKVTFTNNDSVWHNITFDTGTYPASSIAPGASVIIDTSGFYQPGNYGYHCSIHPSMKGALTIQ